MSWWFCEVFVTGVVSGFYENFVKNACRPRQTHTPKQIWKTIQTLLVNLYSLLTSKDLYSDTFAGKENPFLRSLSPQEQPTGKKDSLRVSNLTFAAEATDFLSSLPNQ